MPIHIAKTELAKLTPLEFENLIFDLVIFSGLYNVTWRNPAADGGRDIVGLFLSKEFSGNYTNEIWNIECKHYSKSLSWSLISEKIYTALNDDVDYLLIATSSTISNQCKDKIEKWNMRHNRPQVRFWQYDIIVNMINMNQYIKSKYFFQEIEYISFFTNDGTSHLRELILVAFSEIDDECASPSLTSTASIIELIDDAYHDMLNYKCVTSKKITRDDLFNYVKISNISKANIDRYIFKVVTSLLYTYTRPSHLQCNINGENSIKISLMNKRFDINQAKISYINQLASIKNYTMFMKNSSTIILSLR